MVKSSNSAQARIVIIGASVFMALLMGGLSIYLATRSSEDDGEASNSDRLYCYLVLRDDIVPELNLTPAQNAKRALGTVHMDGKLTFIIDPLLARGRAPGQKIDNVNKVDRREKGLNQLGASLKRMLTPEQQKIFNRIRRREGLGAVELTRDGKTFTVTFTRGPHQAAEARYEPLSHEDALAYLKTYDDAIDLLENNKRTTESLDRSAADLALVWMTRSQTPEPTMEYRRRISKMLWERYDDPDCGLNKDFIVKTLSLIGCGDGNGAKWIKVAEEKNVREPDLVRGLIQFDFEAANARILEAGRQNKYEAGAVRWIAGTGQKGVETLVQYNEITKGKFWGEINSELERAGVKNVKVKRKDEFPVDPEEVKREEARKAEEKRKSDNESFLQALANLKNLDDEYAPSRGCWSLIRNDDDFLALADKHGSPVPLIAKWVERKPKPEWVSLAMYAAGYYAKASDAEVFKNVFSLADEYGGAKGWATGALCKIAPEYLNQITAEDLSQPNFMNSLGEACKKLRDVPAPKLAPLLKVANREQTIQIARLIAISKQPGAKSVLESIKPDPALSERDAKRFNRVIQGFMKDLSN